MSETFKVELSRTRAIAIGACAAGACILLFVAGTASGLLLASNAAGLPLAQNAPAQPKYQPVPAEEETGPAEPKPATAALDANTLETADSSTEASGNPPSLAVLAATPRPAVSPSTPAAPGPDPARPSQTPANPSQLSAGASEAAADPSRIAAGYGLPLAVKVCSFSGKTGADNLAALLQSNGYHASVLRSLGAEDRVWYVVTVGPYRQWNAAASAAAHVAIIANVQPVVAELR